MILIKIVNNKYGKRQNLHILESKINGTIYYNHLFHSHLSTNNLLQHYEGVENDYDAFSRASHVWSERSITDGQRYDNNNNQQQQQLNQKQPWVVIEVANEYDVQLVVPVLVDLQINYQFPFRVRSGGHNKAGMSTVANGAILSLVRLNHIIIHNNSSIGSSSSSSSIASSDMRIVQLGPAVLVQDFIRTILVKHGYGGVTGYCGTVTEGGFILGGGIGIQSRLYGLGLDNAIGMCIVLANGSVHYVSSNDAATAASTTNITSSLTTKLQEDLFWALRGAGGGSLVL